MPNFENMDSFGYTILQQPLESLNIVFPNPEFDELIENRMDEHIDELESTDNQDIIKKMIGKIGLSNIMNSKSIQSEYSLRYNFEYKPDVLNKYGRIFNEENIGKYSNKIAEICNCIRHSNGIIIIYSQFIDGGVVPIALALEEMGFTRYGSSSHTKPLFKNPPT